MAMVEQSTGDPVEQPNCGEQENIMKKKHVILEYCEAKSAGRRGGKWGFRFKTAEGDTLIESEQHFGSLEQAEQGFVALMKSIATNEYTVDYPEGAPQTGFSNN